MANRTDYIERKYSLIDLHAWTKGFDLGLIDQKNIAGASFSIQYSTGGDILVSLYAYTQDGYTLIDGHQSVFSYKPGFNRFNQKRFDAIAEKWIPEAIHLCALYIIKGYTEPSWMNSILDDIAGLINSRSSYTPRMFFVDTIDKLKVLQSSPSSTAPTEAPAPVSEASAEEQPDPEQPIVTHDEPTIVQRFRNSLRNGGRCIYNVSNGQAYNLPAIYPTVDVIDPIPDGQQFDGWEGCAKLTMFDYAAMHEYRKSHNGEDPTFDVDQLLSMKISDEMNREFGKHLEDFHINDDDCSAVFIRVNYEDTFFEYIITDTLPHDAA